MDRRGIIGNVLSDLAFHTEKPVDEDTGGIDIGRAFEDAHLRDCCWNWFRTVVAYRGAVQSFLVGAILCGWDGEVELTRRQKLQIRIHPLTAELWPDFGEELGQKLFGPFLAVGLPQTQGPELRPIA